MTSHETPDFYYSSIEEQYLAREGVDLRWSLTRPALAYRDAIFAFYSEQGLVARIGTAAATAAISAGRGIPYRTGKSHVLPAWLLVPFTTGDPHRWADYVELAYNHARAGSLDSDGEEG